MNKSRFYSYFYVLINTLMAHKIDEKFMYEALAEAMKALEKQEVPIGAVVVFNNTIIARAHNLTETLKDPTAHAEMQAITAATHWLGGKYLNECIVYVTLEPCVMCAGALGWAHTGTLVYGASDEQKGFTRLPGPILHKKTKVYPDLLKNDCKTLITDFFKNKR